MGLEGFPAYRPPHLSLRELISDRLGEVLILVPALPIAALETFKAKLDLYLLRYPCFFLKVHRSSHSDIDSSASSRIQSRPATAWAGQPVFRTRQ